MIINKKLSIYGKTFIIVVLNSLNELRANTVDLSIESLGQTIKVTKNIFIIVCDMVWII